MRKIPTLFRRDPEDMRRVLPEAHPDCQWVLDGEGAPTRKFDGACVMYDLTQWWARREVKAGKREPEGFVPIMHDEATGKTVGWERAEQSPFAKFLIEALDGDLEAGRMVNCPPVWLSGTYELCGPKVNGNPERFTEHVLIRHDGADEIKDAPRDYTGLAEFLADFPHEGIVWHHPDGRMAKIKRRDFPGEGS